MGNETRRDKEDKQTELCKNPDDNNTKDYSNEISKLINHAIKTGAEVYITTDWHLWKRENKSSTKCHKRYDFNKIINNVKEVVNENDVIINLGDLVDGEFTCEEELRKVLLEIPGKKVLVRGNNDLFNYNFYRSCGFRYVTRSFIWADNIFTHMPVTHNNEANVHGHIHGYKTYWVPYNNHIDVAYLGGRVKLVKLKEVINSISKYSKLIKEEPEHFNESVSMFESVFNNIQDPYDD